MRSKILASLIAGLLLTLTACDAVPVDQPEIDRLRTGVLPGQDPELRRRLSDAILAQSRGGKEGARLIELQGAPALMPASTVDFAPLRETATALNLPGGDV